MKVFFVLQLLFASLFISCNSKNAKNTLKLTSIQYVDTLYNLGNCIEGDTLHFYVKYKNVGKNPLQINFSQGACDCTQPYFNKRLINPNKIDSIFVDFYSIHQVGDYRGTVVISANTTPTITQIFFTANVIAKK